MKNMMKIEIDLEQEPENVAEQIYEKLSELPLEIRKNLQKIVEEFTLIHPVKLSEIKNYAENHSSYQGEVDTIDDLDD